MYLHIFDLSYVEMLALTSNVLNFTDGLSPIHNRALKAGSAARISSSTVSSTNDNDGRAKALSLSLLYQYVSK